MSELGVRASRQGTRDESISSKALSRVGYWTRDEVIAMDRNATLQMARYHLNHASPEIRKILLDIKRQSEIPEFTAPDANLLISELFLSLPDSDGHEDASPVEVRRGHLETAKAIRKAIAAKHSITINDMDSDCRNKSLVLARQEAMYLIARECPSLSYPRMGRIFGGKDHTTILHGIRKHADRNGLPRVREGSRP